MLQPKNSKLIKTHQRRRTKNEAHQREPPKRGRPSKKKCSTWSKKYLHFHGEIWISRVIISWWRNFTVCLRVWNLCVLEGRKEKQRPDLICKLVFSVIDCVVFAKTAFFFSLLFFFFVFFSFSFLIKVKWEKESGKHNGVTASVLFYFNQQLHDVASGDWPRLSIDYQYLLHKRFIFLLLFS